MPIRTRARKSPDRKANRGPDPRLSRLPRLLAVGAALAATELLIAVVLGRFFSWGRAEALLFFAFRPWLLLVAAFIVSRWPAVERTGLYAGFLLLAAISESLFLISLGAQEPWREAVRGLAAGAVLAVAVDLTLQVAQRLFGELGHRIAAAAVLAVFFVPGALAPYEAIAIGGAGNAAVEKRDLMMITGLPLVWGEHGPLDPRSRPAGSFKALEREFNVRPLDVLDARSLASGRLLLIAQPRPLAPSELVALDNWVRRGGRALILTDPMLLWPSDLPIGDVRRAPAIGLLRPLLAHWGVRMETPSEARLVVEEIRTGGETRRLVVFAPGRFASAACTIASQALVADCRIGAGRAILIADADMMHDRLWIGPGTAGAERHGRVADNPLIVADLLDELAGAPRRRPEKPVAWLDSDSNRGSAILLALLPLALAAAPAAWRSARAR